MKILIVDDSKAMRNILTKSMKAVGFLRDQYDYAADGEEALTFIQQHSPDLVMCDMHMPQKSGLELLGSLRASKNHTKVIIVSIDDNKETIDKVKKAGADGYLKKPFTNEKLIGILAAVLPKDTKGPSTPSTSGYNINDLLPLTISIERVLGSLAGVDMQWKAVGLDTVDFSRSPFYGGTFADEKRLVLAVFLDALAANTIAAIINKHPLADAVMASNAHEEDEYLKEAILTFLSLFSGLCPPLPSGKLLEVHGTEYSENAELFLKERIYSCANKTKVFSIQCGPSQGGKILLIAP